ncbi:PH-like domain-containing protein [Rathayibacter soli]|uniref:PH-like domain-containing protein n=1 Tax=Rathayibacter soli TaxID=3144168 RepID=UPI0027E50911|nr:hypothetical protein [Glaciibacter superstes]
MDKFGPTIIIVVIVALVFILMWWGWRRRVRRDSGLHPAREVPQDLGPVHRTADVLYVATTAHDRELERLAIDGLRFPGRATITVAEQGALIAVTGERETFVPASAIIAADAATVAIDRVVETGGLIRLAWNIDAATVADSYLRAVDPDDRAPLIDALNTVASAQAAANDASTDSSPASADDDPESEV